jgi:cystathionine beta-lyase/cystathionine gamma-synthase
MSDVEELHFIQNASGGVPGPMDCFLILRGIKTLPLRMKKACKNARKIAYWLQEQPEVAKVYYPGLTEHPGHEIASRQMSLYGGMVSFDLKQDNQAVAHQFMARTKLFTCAESLGGVESLIGHPATMTHASIPRDERYAAGLKDSLVRLSVGIEDAGDLIDDLSTAFQAL